MSDTSKPVSLILEDNAKLAIRTIASLLGNTDADEAVGRALGTELYLLQQVKGEGAKVVLEYEDGGRAEVDLFG